MEGSFEVTGGTAASNKPAIDVKQWLAKNKLSDIEKVFTERNVSIEELTEFTDQDLSEFAKELGLDILARKRFVKGIAAVRRNVIASQTANINSNRMDAMSAMGAISSQQQARRGAAAGSGGSGGRNLNSIVSKAEHQAISKLYVRFDDSSRCMNDLHHSFNILNESRLSCLNEINNKFDIIFKELEFKKHQLYENIGDLKENKTQTLMKQLELLKQHSKNLDKAKMQYEGYVRDTSLDSEGRKRIVLRMANEILNDPKISLLMNTQPKLLFSKEKTQKSLKNFTNLLKIDDCDQPRQFKIQISKTKFNYIQIEIIMDTESLKMCQVKPITDLAVEWAQLPHKQCSVFKKKASKQKQKHKNKKKKRSKKHKKDTDSDSSDSESDSDSSSNSDSDSEEDESDSSNSDNDATYIIDEKSANDMLDNLDEDTIKWNYNVKVSHIIDGNQDSTGLSESGQNENNSEIKQNSDENGNNSDSNNDRNSNENSGSENENQSESDESDSKQESSKKSKKKNKHGGSGLSVSKLKKLNKNGKIAYKINELKDNRIWLLRVCGKNVSGWGIYSPISVTMTKKIVIDSKILKNKEKQQLMKLIPKGKKLKWKLLYRATEKGFQGSTFHSICNGHAPTVTVVHTTMNYVFGGYTAMPWTSNGNYATDNDALIFLLRSQRKDKPMKWGVQNVSYSVNHNGSYGPTFGGGHDFYLANGCNTNSSSYTNLGHSYAAPKDKSMLAGGYNFMVKDYEVWELKKK